MLKKILLGALVLVLAAGAVMLWQIGPRNAVGMLRYDTRKEGQLRVGDRAPDAAVLALDGKTPVHLAESIGGKPRVLVLGSFT